MRKILYCLTTILVCILFVGGACGGKVTFPEDDNTQVEPTPNPDNGGENGGENGDDEPSDEKPEAKDGEFVILFTNDFHSQIEPLGMDETYNANRGGAKRIKALVDSVRQAEPAVLLADAGDFVQGTY